ncbi:MAG: esterase, partial [Actinomadura rubrobrunea]|nr:esterase [Actinomadura rubrobrunea]
MATTTTDVVLEPAAQEFAKATAKPPYLFDLGPVKGRETVDQVQSGEIDMPAAEIEKLRLSGPTGEFPVKIVRPEGETGVLPVVLYI